MAASVISLGKLLAKLQEKNGCHLSQAHAFIDGNKRVAAALIFLDSNSFETTATVEEIINVFCASLWRNELR